MAYRADESSRDRDWLRAHFTSDVDIIGPCEIFCDRDTIKTVYQKSFDPFPKPKVDVRAGFPGPAPIALSAARCCLTPPTIAGGSRA
jgi:hypothetical protein